MVRICLIGKMGAGKSTVAQIICENVHNMQTLSLAEPVKAIATEHFGMAVKDRRLLQIIGGTGRALNPNTWIDILLRKVEDTMSYVIDDARFPTEIEQLKKEGFVVVYVDASVECRLGRLKNRYGIHAQQHIDNMHDPSESQLTPEHASHVLENTYLPMDILKKQVIEVIQKIN